MQNLTSHRPERLVRLVRLVKVALLPALVVTLGGALLAQGMSGAVFTTNVNGTFVNANVYQNSTEPYLNGGPRANGACTAVGLPNGDYYFQVTDPSGAELLSTDDVTYRKVTVAGGKITAANGSHSTGFGRCGDVTVQLWPFLETSNHGEEYKVWMTPVSAYSPGQGSYGFLPRSSKTDSFKVTAPSSLVDSDGDGFPDSEDACPAQYSPGTTNGCILD